MVIFGIYTTLWVFERNAPWKKQIKNSDIDIFTEEDRKKLNEYFNKIWPRVEQLAEKYLVPFIPYEKANSIIEGVEEIEHKTEDLSVFDICPAVLNMSTNEPIQSSWGDGSVKRINTDKVQRFYQFATALEVIEEFNENQAKALEKYATDLYTVHGRIMLYRIIKHYIEQVSSHPHENTEIETAKKLCVLAQQVREHLGDNLETRDGGIIFGKNHEPDLPTVYKAFDDYLIPEMESCIKCIGEFEEYNSLML